MPSKKLKGRGGPGRGQGNKKMKDKRVKISINVPPKLLEKITRYQDVTGESLSGTCVWIIDNALPLLNNTALNQKEM